MPDQGAGKGLERRHVEHECEAPQCKNTFPRYYEMKRHMVKMHPEQCLAWDLRQYRDKRTEKRQCTKCGKKRSAANMAVHQRSEACRVAALKKQLE